LDLLVNIINTDIKVTNYNIFKTSLTENYMERKLNFMKMNKLCQKNIMNKELKMECLKILMNKEN